MGNETYSSCILELFHFFLHIYTVQPCGVLYNYSESLLLLNGFVKCYDQSYSSFTSSRDLDACNGSQYVFVGAKTSSYSTHLAIGAFGTTKILANTYSTSTAYYDPGGAYWYRYPSYSFGFASSSSVNLYTCDISGLGNDDCAHRLCWHLDQSGGGWRAGCRTGLNDQTWRKVIYKGNTAPACFPGNTLIQVVKKILCGKIGGIEMEGYSIVKARKQCF